MWITICDTTQSAFTCSNLTIETLKQGVNTFKVNKHQNDAWRRSGVFIVNFETYFTYCSNASIFSFELVHAGWEDDAVYHTEVYLEPCQTIRWWFYLKIVNNLQPLFFFTTTKKLHHRCFSEF